MRPEDVDAVRALDAQAFTPYMRRLSNSDNEVMPMRTRENILASLALNPEGCFVAEDSAPAGYIFSRKLGTVGWIGVFGVQPERHGQGIGGALLSAAVGQLAALGCTTIGLETMPDSPYNVGFYARAGFRPSYSVLTLEQTLALPQPPAPAACLSRVEQAAGLRTVTAISQSACPGLDYAPEAQNAMQFGWGEVLLIGWPQAWALAVVRAVPRREGPAEGAAMVGPVAVVPQARSRLVEALAAAEQFARAQGLTHLVLSANSGDWPALQTLLATGFRVAQVNLRLLCKGGCETPPGIDLYRWAM